MSDECAPRCTCDYPTRSWDGVNMSCPIHGDGTHPEAGPVVLVLERDWHEHVCGCDGWSEKSEPPQRGCGSTMTAPDFWTVDQVLHALDLVRLSRPGPSGRPGSARGED